MIEESKEFYYKALRKTQTTLRCDSVEWEPWLLFFLRCLVRQKENLNLKIEIERQTLERTSPLGAAVVRLLEDTDRITLAEAVKGTGANRNTLKVKINELVETGVLERHGRGRGVFYTRMN